MTSRNPARQLTFVCGSDGSATDAIVQYAHAMTSELCLQAVQARVVVVDPRCSVRQLACDIADLGDQREGSIFLQYSPFSFGRAGIAPGLVLGVRRIRQRASAVSIVLMCHETVSLAPGLKWRAVRVLHRAQLAVLARWARTIFVSTPAWSQELVRLSGRTPIELPVGSNLPDRRARRAHVRQRLELDGTLLLASFSTGHPSHRDDLLREALLEILPHRPGVALLTLGAGREPLGLPEAARVRELRPGLLPSDELADLVAAADIFVSPYVDGASTRRGTIMAALQHAVPVVATVGSSTDAVLRTHLGRYGVPSGDPAALGAAINHLAEDPKARAEHGLAGRRLYEQHFDWPVTARRVAAVIFR